MRRHNQLLFRTARSILKSDVETEDVVQEAYLLAWRAIGSFRADAKLSTWLVRIVINQASPACAGAAPRSSDRHGTDRPEMRRRWSGASCPTQRCAPRCAVIEAIAAAGGVADAPRTGTTCG